MEMALVTGVSKGLGFEVSKALAEQGKEVIGLSRSINEQVRNLIAKSDGRFSHECIDLSHVEEIEPFIKKICRQIAARKPQKVYVVNNASTVEPIERVGFLDNSAIQRAVHLNLLAPMLINNTLLNELKNEAIEVVIVNVTSGAAERPIHGWSVYGATKAAVNMHTKVAGLEQEQTEASHKMIAFSPGIMDTDMQGRIRDSEKEAFTDIDQFKRFKTSGALRNPVEVAHALVHLILDEQLVNGTVYYVDELI
ncbi:(S)-benzoin forming benzil reductase [Sporolactobacillus sp. STSJ-5]|uniref:(S)-benzoin forming benzil reductase n=1 Tax=Sporolactobacillus sp. STSJ-5 TaxID=2965076 RepID=UPI0021020708|nr:(S)-benzoin forming benzil reductase [Sporolactobacillus sp. STSJ-5]MCQ2010158.1 (S)-benzoin forming benzil reductase [Sporolactobacillus sp. STSJ-5]